MHSSWQPAALLRFGRCCECESCTPSFPEVPVSSASERSPKYCIEGRDEELPRSFGMTQPSGRRIGHTVPMQAGRLAGRMDNAIKIYWNKIPASSLASRAGCGSHAKNRAATQPALGDSGVFFPLRRAESFLRFELKRATVCFLELSSRCQPSPPSGVGTPLARRKSQHLPSNWWS